MKVVDPPGRSTGSRRHAPVWAEPIDRVARRLGATEDGLTSEGAAAALGRHGPNVLDLDRQASAPRLLAKQFTSPILLILLGATVLSGLLGELTAAGIILTIIGLSGLLGFWQEHTAGRAMVTLLRLVEVRASVVRDGEQMSVPMSAVVPGDLALVSAGDLVPGDCVVVAANGLMVDQSVLTGETFPAEKTATLSADGAEVGERPNMLFFGTHVSSGSGTVLVTATGHDTEMGEVAQHLGSPTTTGFERGMTAFGLLLTRIMVALVVVIFAINLVLQRPFIDSALFSLALAVGLTPQLLPAVVSISLAHGARTIAKERVIVRRLDAIEDFGSMTILCSDKTGTMTQGHVRLSAALGLDGEPAPPVERLARINAEMQVGLKNPIDEAIVAASPSDIGTVTKLGELPYDFDRKRLSVLVRDASSGPDPILITKGAFGPVLEVCESTTSPDGKVAPLGESRDSIVSQFEELSRQGFRVLAVATRRIAGTTPLTVGDEAGMTLVGLLTFADPPKDGITATLGALASNGISVRMVTGDNRFIATHLAHEVGLDTKTVLTGNDIAAMDAPTLTAAVASVEVFSELSPLHKERIVRAMRSSGSVVGYLGDGINDAPALQAADVGISVDTAVAVAKRSAAIVLLDKDLGVLLAGVRQGRRTFANTMKYIFVTTSANFGNMLSMAVAATVLPFLPLLAGQILMVNLLTDLPGTTIATDSVDRSQLTRPQSWDIGMIMRYMLVFGAISSVFDLATFALLRWEFDAAAPEFRSAWFLGSILTEVAVLFALRTRGPFYRSKPSRWLVLSSLFVLAIAIGLPFTPVADSLELVKIPLELFVLIAALTVGYVATTEIVKHRFWKRETRTESRS